MDATTDVHYRTPMKRRFGKKKKAGTQQAKKIYAHFKRIDAMRDEIAELKSTIDAQAEQIHDWARKYETLVFSLDALMGHQQRHEDALNRLKNSNEIIVRNADGRERLVYRDGSKPDVVISRW